MIFAPKVIANYGLYNFYPKQLYLLKTKRAELVIRTEWFSGTRARMSDYEVVGASTVDDPLSAISQGHQNVNWVVYIRNGTLSFIFKEQTKDKTPSYKGRIVFKFLGLLPMSIHSFTAQTSSISALLNDTQSHVQKLQ